MYVGADAEDKMVMALTSVTIEKAKICVASMCKRAPTTTFIEVNGRSIRDQSLLTRGNLNVEGFNDLRLRTTRLTASRRICENAKIASSPDKWSTRSTQR